MADAQDPLQELLQALQEILVSVASGQPLERPWAYRYSDLRTKLLESYLKTKVPGFLLQCGSIDRFREFILLYHPKPESRAAFIDAALARCWAEVGGQPPPN